jgi:cytochrome P450
MLQGNLRSFRHDRLGFLAGCASQYGDFVPFRLGQLRVILLGQPDQIEMVLSRRADCYSKNYLGAIFHPLLRSRLLLGSRDTWLAQRRLVQPDMRSDRMVGYSEIMVDEAERLCASWQDGQDFDVSADMRRLTLQVLARALFDVDLAHVAKGAAATVDLVLEDFGARMERRVHLPFILPTLANRRIMKALAWIDHRLTEMIDERRTRAEGRHDLLSRLVGSGDLQGHALTNQEVKLAVLPLLFAGHETTAMALTWALFLLARHPEAQSRMAAELGRIPSSRRVTISDVPSLRYTRWVVQESLRLYPPIWGFGRTAERETRLGPYDVPAGTVVFISPWVLHRDARHFERPDLFDPERWSSGLARRLPPYAYLPFGAGSRSCLGSGFALLEATLVLATVCRRFRIGPSDVPEPGLDPLITLRPKESPQLTVYAR